jgi:hypothetical protein
VDRIRPSCEAVQYLSVADARTLDPKRGPRAGQSAPRRTGCPMPPNTAAEPLASKRERRRHLGIRGELKLALLPTVTILLVLVGLQRVALWLLARLTP